jgi:phosphoenolpyruvate carboxylase
MQIAEDYTQLCHNHELATSVFSRIKQENETTIDFMLKIANVDRLLAEAPVLELSLSRRERYLDPLGFIQINLLKKYRDESVEETLRDAWKDPLLSSINAIAAGMRNTG